MAKKTQLTYREIEDRLRCLKDSNFTKNEITKDEIGYRILFGFGKSERELDRYCEGKGVIHTFDGLLIKVLFCYRSSSTLRFADDLDGLKRDYQVLKAAPRIIAYTYIDEADSKRYLRRYDVIRFYVGYHEDRDSALVEVKNTTYNDGFVKYHLGRIQEHVKQKKS